MSARDDRYNRSERGKAREARRRASTGRRAWVADYNEVRRIKWAAKREAEVEKDASQNHQEPTH